jgi:uracil-DNA glycosylase family 4
MSSTSADDLLPDELAALMHFYAEAGVTWLSEDGPVDRFAEPVAPPRSRAPDEGGQAGRETAREGGSAGGIQRPARQVAAPAVMAAPMVAVPDAEAIEAARVLAANASTPEELIAAVDGFAACNLKSSARHTVFAEVNASARVVVVSGMPSSEDDREGRPFSGAAGQMLGRMLAGIGIGADAMMTVNMIPWRTPGDRAPTVREVEICRPFAQRLVELVQPDAVLVLGNLPARVLSNDPKAGIHALRGKWFEFSAGASPIPALATFHPLEMLTMPASKRVAWQDLLLFGSKITAAKLASRADL